VCRLSITCSVGRWPVLIEQSSRRVKSHESQSCSAIRARQVAANLLSSQMDPDLDDCTEVSCNELHDVVVLLS